jgi:hypothetical protein
VISQMTDAELRQLDELERAYAEAQALAATLPSRHR